MRRSSAALTRRTVLASWGLATVGHSLQGQPTRLSPNTRSEVMLEVKKTGLMAGKTHRLVFTQYEGVVSQQPTPQVTFTVQSGSVVCEDDWVKPKDKQKITLYTINDMLEAQKYPTVSYRSTVVETAGDGYTIRGDLTIKDQVKPVTIRVTVPKQGTAQWTGSADFRLTDFNLKPPTAALGAIGTEDTVRLSFHFAA